jgi:uncharacterized membrane protein
MQELFNNNATLIVFLHVFSAVIWVGGMIAIRFAVHFAMQNIEDTKIRLARSLEITRNFFNIVIIFIFVLLFTAIIMLIALGLTQHAELKTIALIKEGIWTFMTLNFIAMYFRRGQAEKAFVSGDTEKAKKISTLITNYMIPINIILGVIAIYLGVTLRGL